MPRRLTTRVARPQRRTTTNWSGLVPAAMVTVPAISSVHLISITLSNAGIGEVVRRTRGQLLVTSDQGANIETQMGAMGFCVVTDAAAAIGITALPTPVTDASDDIWFVWQSFLQFSGAGPGAAAADGTVTPYEFDSKAMRRVEEGRQIAVVVQNSSAVHGLQVAVANRMLSSRIG